MNLLFGSGIALFVAAMVMGSIIHWAGTPLGHTLWVVPVFNILGLFCFIGALSQFGRRHQSELNQLEREHRDFLEVLTTEHLGLKLGVVLAASRELRGQIIETVEELKRMEPLYNGVQLHLWQLMHICTFLRFSNEITREELKMLRCMIACLIVKLAASDARGKNTLDLGLKLGSDNRGIDQTEAQQAALYDVYARLTLSQHLPTDRPERPWEKTLRNTIARRLTGWRPPKTASAGKIADQRWGWLMEDDWIKCAVQDGVMAEAEVNAEPVD